MKPYQIWADKLKEEIENYLSNGGIFNPEAMEHDKVRQLLIECRNFLSFHATKVL
jgi:hypothetical protein